MIQVEYLPVSELIPYIKNPRKNDPAVNPVAQSIKEFGFKIPILIDKDNVIIAGHTRLKAALKLNLSEVPIIRADDLTPEQVKALRLADNKLGELAEWDMNLLIGELSDLKTQDFDINLTGFNENELAEMLKNNPQSDISIPEQDAEPQIDRAEELNKIWQVKTGDLWQLGEHRLICGDCTDPAVVERVMQGEKAELCFTSPPYSDMREYKSEDAAEISKLKKFIPAIKPNSEYCVVNLGIKVKDRKIVQYWDEYVREAETAGYSLLCWGVWDKLEAGSVSNQSAMFAIEHEWIFVFGTEFKKLNRTLEKSPDDAKRRQYDRKDSQGRSIRGVRQADGTMRDSTRGEAYEYKNLPSVVQVKPYKARGDNTTGAHPAVMPVELPTIYIEAITDKGQLVIEPFLGSGTTLIACENTGRKCRGIEISPDYCAVILQRFQDASGKTPVRVS